MVAYTSHRFATFRQDLLALVRRHMVDNTPEEMLAVAAFAVGQLMAHQDPRRCSTEELKSLVAENIVAGNRVQVGAIIASAGGRQ